MHSERTLRSPLGGARLLAAPRSASGSRFFARCSGSNCPHRHLLWPRWLCSQVGLELAGKWFCGVECAATSLELRVHALLATFFVERPRAHRVPLGLLLVKRGVISYAEMRDALSVQKELGRGRLGDWLRSRKPISDDDLTAALAQQWGCPVFPLERQPVHLSWPDIVPLPLFESSRAVPAHVSADGGVLHVAFCDRVDHTLLYGLEQILGCRTIACVATESGVTAILDHLRHNAANLETCFDTTRDPREIAWIIGNYARELRARKIAMVRAGAFLWTRFVRGSSFRDLLFRILPERPLMSFAAPGWAEDSASSADEPKEGVSGQANSR